MLALVLAMLLCVALGAGVVGYVMIEARREGRGDFWTPEGEELIAGVRRTGEKVRSRGEQRYADAPGAYAPVSRRDEDVLDQDVRDDEARGEGDDRDELRTAS